MGNVVPLRKPGVCVPLLTLVPQLTLMPSAVIAVKLQEVGVRFQQGVLSVFLAHNGVLLDSVNLVKVAREHLVGATSWVPQENFFRSGERLGLDEVSPRIVLELLLQPYLLPDGDYYAAWDGSVRLHLSKWSTDRIVVKTEPTSNLVRNNSTWIWQDKEF